VVSRNSASQATECVQARLTDVTRIYPGGPGKPPFHALGPVSLELRAESPRCSTCLRDSIPQAAAPSSSKVKL
jgi:hypothetical protein